MADGLQSVIDGIKHQEISELRQECNELRMANQNLERLVKESNSVRYPALLLGFVLTRPTAKWLPRVQQRDTYAWLLHTAAHAFVAKDAGALTVLDAAGGNVADDPVVGVLYALASRRQRALLLPVLPARDSRLLRRHPRRRRRHPTLAALA